MTASQSAGAPMPVVILETKMIQKGALVAVVKIGLGKMILHDVALLCANGKAWAGAPSKPMIGREGVVLKGDNGKARYTPIVEWADKETRERFSASVILAFEAEHGPILAVAGGGA